MKTIIDFRSDTVTLPTNKMRQAIFEAELGDDVIGEDPTVKRLEDLAAKITGKEASLLVTSGTLGNQLAIKTHTVPGNEIILEEISHIAIHELGASAVISGVQTKMLTGRKGIMSPLEIEKKIAIEDDHTAGTRLLCIENPHNIAGGTVIPLELLKEYNKIAKKANLKVHMDGARIFNAAIALKIDVKELTKYVDSLMFCLSKNLCAPVGSMLCGTKKFIESARRFRKMLGGGMRQAGIIASAGIVALEDMVDRLEEDHLNARILAEGLSHIEGLKIDLDTVETNMVFFSTQDAENLVKSLEDRGILCWNLTPSRIRMAVHYYIKEEDVFYTVDQIRDLLRV